MKAILFLMALPVSMLANAAETPEPSTYLMLGGGLGAMLMMRKFTRKKK